MGQPADPRAIRRVEKSDIARPSRAGDAALRRLLSRAEIARAVDENARDALADVPRKIVERHLISRARRRRTHAALYPICRPLRLSENLADYETLAFVVFPLYLVTDVFFLFRESRNPVKVSGLYHSGINPFVTKDVCTGWSVIRDITAKTLRKRNSYNYDNL